MRLAAQGPCQFRPLTSNVRRHTQQAQLARMEFISDFAAWAWARHHNLLSWYIRPLFLVPFCYFSFKRSPLGISLTLIALLTSMFWFPAPVTPSPGVVEALRAEREYLLGSWSTGKFALSLLVPGMLFALALGFWRRSFLWGAVALNATAALKVGWTAFAFSSAGFLEHAAPAIAGLLICNLLLYAWYRRRHRNDA
jgi:hypothetical protein